MRARLIRHGELVHHLDARQLRLRGRPVAAPWRRRYRGVLRLRARAPLRRRPEQGALALREEFFQKLQVVLDAARGVATEAGEFGNEGLDLGVELLVLALEEDRHLTQELRIAELIELKHERTTSSARATSKQFLRVVDEKGRGRERDAAHERAAFEEELQLAHREPPDARRRLAPQRREAPALEPLGVDAEAGAVPEQDLGPLARCVPDEARRRHASLPSRVGSVRHVGTIANCRKARHSRAKLKPDRRREKTTPIQLSTHRVVLISIGFRDTATRRRTAKFVSLKRTQHRRLTTY